MKYATTKKSGCHQKKFKKKYHFQSTQLDKIRKHNTDWGAMKKLKNWGAIK
jgi:hypothetical protein